MVDDGSHVCRNETRPVPRTILGFHQDQVGDWVAELSCLHNQHVRHRPPFQVRPWVARAEGRARHVGTEIDCPPCARAEPPAGLAVVRTAGPFDAATLPAGLLKDHVVADGTWGCLHVLEGRVTFCLRAEPPSIVDLGAGEQQNIPPGLPHALILAGPVRLTIDFLTGP